MPGGLDNPFRLWYNTIKLNGKIGSRVHCIEILPKCGKISMPHKRNRVKIPSKTVAVFRRKSVSYVQNRH